MKKTLSLKQFLAALLTIAALASGLTAQATVQTGIMMQGLARTVNNETRFAFVIQSDWGGDQITNQTGSSYTFSNATIIHGTVDVTLNGKLNFQVGTAFADVITGSSFTVTITSSSLWFYGATVQTKSGTNVTGCTVTTSSNHNTLTVTIPSGKTFGAVILDYVSNPPMTNSNTTVTVPAGDYWVSNANLKPQPEPTVVYGQTTLVKDTDYTLSWSNNSSAGTGTVTVTGIGNYAGSATGIFYIRWAIYYVHFDKNHDDATGTISDQVFIYNTAQALTANTFSRTGYSFDGWSTTSNGAVTYTDGQSVNNLTAEDGQTVTLYAQWAPITYNISYDLAGGSVATANPTTYNIETATFTLNNPTRTGYTFAGWTGSNGTTPQTTVTINQGSIGDRSFTANWVPITYNISYDLAGGSVATANPTTYNIETATFTLNSPIRTGYTFAGWTGTDLDEPTMDVTIAQGSIGDRNYTATWDPIPYNLTYDLAGGSVATANPTTYNIETATFTLNNPTKVACNFDGWTGSNGDTPETTVTIAQGSTGDRSYTAQWTQYAYPLSLGTDITASGTVAFTYEGTDYFTPGTIITLAYGGTIPEGYRPLYSVNGNAIVGNTFEMPAADVVIEAVLLERYYTYNSTTGELALIFGAFNGSNKWGSEVTPSAVTSVTATDEVSFTGDCSSLFRDFTNCTSMDLTDVNTDNVTDMSYMFYGCRGLQSLDVSGWNTASVTNMSYLFYNCSSLTTLDVSGWNTASVTNMNSIFENCWNLTTLGVSGWNTASVTDMSYMFRGCLSLTTLDLSNWNTASVTDMSHMFWDCSSLESLDVSNWDIGSVTTMYNMFNDCSGLESLDVSGWNTDSVTDMSNMFDNCSSLTTLDLSNWNTASVTDMSGMFRDCSSLTTIYAGSGWSTENVTYWGGGMFYGCTNLVGGMGTGFNNSHTDTDYARFDRGPESEAPGYLTGVFALTLTDDITASPAAAFTHGDMSLYIQGTLITLTYSGVVPEGYAPIYSTNGNPFGGNSFFMPIEDITVTVDVQPARYTFDSETGALALLWGEFNSYFRWGNEVPADEVTSVTATNEVSFTGDCSMLFDQFISCTSMDLSNVNTDEMTATYGMFGGCISLETLDLSDFNTANVTNMSNMFQYCSGLQSLDISNWNTSNVEYMNHMFYGCSGLQSLNISNWNTSNVWSTYNMFNGCESLETLDLSDFNTANVTNMSNMFQYCSGLQSLDISNWNTSNVGVMDEMFYGCSNLTTLDLSNWNTSNVWSTYNMFNGCSNLTTIYVGEDWSTDEVDFSFNMFTGCTNLVGGMGTTYDENHTDKAYARIDGGPDNPGYFTAIPLDPVEYIDADGVAQTLYDYTLLEGSNEFIEYGEYNTEAWYVVAHDVTYNEGIRFYGSANLILEDGATLTVRRVSVGHNYLLCDTDLTIYVQSGGTGAIVGENIMLDSNGSMTIHGGQISVEKEGGNGIRASNNLTINGGVVSVTETANGTAIYSEHLVINGGVVTTTNQQGGSGILGFYELTINGGVVTTTNQQGGYGIYGFYELTINGGNVTTTNQQGGYGIYGYYEVTINGGLVTANATEGAYGIGVEYSYRIITLGWTDETDRITSDSYYGTVTVATGQAFVDVAGNYYMNTLTDSQMAAMSGQTLIPFDDFDMPFAITYETNGGTLPSGYPATYTFAETVTLPTPTKEDNIFRGWYDNADFEDYPVTEITAGTALGAKTFYAYWAPKHTDVTYLDADGQPQTVRATVLYENETYTGVYEGGVYTILDTDGYVYYDLLRFNGDATLILPDGGYLGAGGAGKGATDSEEYGLFVEGNLTIYGQEKGNGYIASVICEVDGNVNIYGGEVFLYNLTTNADSDINLSWTGLENYIIINPTQGNVHLLKDFVSYSYNEEWEQTFNTILHAGEPVSIADLCNHALYPYIETIDVSYIDENGDEHIAHDAQVLWGNETSLPGGTYTFINSRLQFDHEVTFDGNTTIIVPDDMSITMNNPDGNDITVNSDLAIYGQEERSGYFGSYSEDGIHATGDVTASNFYSATHKISSGGNLLIAGGTQHYTYLVANGTIILGYLAEGDAIQAHDYEGTVVIRAGQTMISYSFEDLYSGTLTPEQVAELGDRRLMPYLTPITLEVEGYGESTESDHWVFIATPIVGSLGPEFVTNLIDGMSPSGQSNFDLYRFNQSAELEWENFYQHLTGGNSFALENGKGYLYANKNDVTLEFNGVVYPAASKEVALDYDANAEFAGWNLVGNPFHAPAILDKSYYKMNSDGTGLVAEAVSGNTTIDAFTGVMVQANGEDETVLFTKSNAKGQQETGFGTLQIALTQTGTRGNALLDNTIVSFNEGDQLGKFYFGTQDANIYIPQGNKEYAIVSVGNTGEMPINFKANENGTYTLTVNPMNVEMGYLHLIDNLTGANVDLLQTPEYVFTTHTTDYESRFKLVFSASANANGDNEAFAFIDASGNIIIMDGPSTGSRTCTLQVIDVMGRVIFSRDAARHVSTSGMTPGVYVLRLINGDTIRTQKIVID